MKEVLDAEGRARIESLLMARYGSYLRGETFKVTALGQSDSIVLKVALESHDRMSRYTFDISAGSRSNGISLSEALDLALDFLGFYLDQFFEENREYLLPLDYQPYEFVDHTVYARGDFTRPKLDEMADRILREGRKIELDDPDPKLQD